MKPVNERKGKRETMKTHKDLDYIRFVYIALGSLSELEKIETDILWLSITNLTKVVRSVRNDS